MKPRVRCEWAGGHPLLAAYHDREWGAPQHDDRRLFELLVLEGAQAGLSWLTILKKRQAYRRAFAGFDAGRVARFGAGEGWGEIAVGGRGGVRPIRYSRRGGARRLSNALTPSAAPSAASVPAGMKLLANRNWYIPKWLDARLPHVSVEAQEGSDSGGETD